MPYLSCPSCGLRINGRHALELESCPRCLGRRGIRVALEAHLGPALTGRFVAPDLDERAAPAPSEADPGLRPAES